MWWRSLIAVLYDLWKFAIGADSELLYAPSQPLRLQAPVSASPPEPAATSVETIVSLQQNVRYDAKHTTTQHIRSYLKKNTTIKTAPADLTPYEWLAYLFTRAGRPLPWLALALAPIGYWHQALKGQSYVTIGVTPRTAALMEWQDEQGTGQVGYITSVTPGDDITVEQLGSQLPGVLQKLTLTAQEWRELRPVFISVQ